jgi:hypothetical protein
MLGSLSSACSLLRWSVISVCLVCFGKTCLGLNIPPTETEYGLVDSDGGPPQGGGITFNDRGPEYRWIDITGNGSVDMSDYRRARDWALVATFGGPPAILDGAPDNPKHDANRNGVVEGIEESYYPRSDFNGDGDGSGSDDLAPVPGVIGGAMVSDLDVLKQLFNDPDYAKLELDGFEWNTVDLHISLYWFAHYNATNGGDADVIRVDVIVNETAPGSSFQKFIPVFVPTEVIETGADLVLSLPAGRTYEIEVSGNTLDDFIYGETIQMTAGQAGTDHWFSPRAFVKLDPGI